MKTYIILAIVSVLIAVSGVIADPVVKPRVCPPSFRFPPPPPPPTSITPSQFIASMGSDNIREIEVKIIYKDDPTPNYWGRRYQDTNENFPIRLKSLEDGEDAMLRRLSARIKHSKTWTKLKCDLVEGRISEVTVSLGEKR